MQECNCTHIKKATQEGWLDINKQDFRVEFKIGDGQQQTITIPFTLKKPIAEAKVVEPNAIIETQGQRLYIREIIRTPLRIQLIVEADKSNTMQILALDDVSIEIDSFNKDEPIKNGFYTSGSLREGQYTLYLQSNYFYDAEELTLKIGQIHALNKGEDYIEVDFGGNEIISKPAFIDWDLKVNNYTVYVDTPLTKQLHQPFYPAEKADGSDLHSVFATVSDHEQKSMYSESYEPYNGVAKLWIRYFVNPIAEDIELKIEL